MIWVIVQGAILTRGIVVGKGDEILKGDDVVEVVEGGTACRDSSVVNQTYSLLGFLLLQLFHPYC